VKRSIYSAKFAICLGLCLLLSGWLIFTFSGLNLSRLVQITRDQEKERKETPRPKKKIIASDFDYNAPGKPLATEAGGTGRATPALDLLQADRTGGHAFYDQPGEAVEFFRRKRLPEGQTELPIERYFNALDVMRGMPQYSSADGLQMPSRAQMKGIAEQQQLGAWTSLGPGNIGGRTRGLLVHPTNPSTMYAAGVAGGVWRTTDGGASWTPLADLIANIAVNSLAMDPSNPNTIYAGTGEGYFNIDAVRGAGIFKTTDGGTTWTRLTSTNNASFYFVNDIVVSPVSSQRVYAATSTGVWRSLDGGMSWTRVLALSINGGCLDLAMRSDRPTDFLFASCGTTAGVSTSVQSTIYRNTDAGDAGDWNVVHTESGMGRTSLAIAPSNQNIVYALSASNEANFKRHGLHAVFRSTNSGDSGSWTAQVRNTNSTKLNTVLLSNPYAAFYGDCGFTPFGPNFLISQGWYDNVIAVDPVDPNRVWAGGIDLFRSDDGGANWGVASYWWANGGVAPLAPQYAHADQHALVFHPQYNGTTNRTMFVGNDGGIFRTTDARAPVAFGGLAACNPGASGVMWTSLNNNYGVTQFYHGVSYPNGASYFGGTQDNGTLHGSDANGPNNWREILGGDGGYVAVDPTNPNIVYAENTGISIQKSTDGGMTFAGATDGISDGGMFINPFIMDSSDPRRLWTGGIYLWRTTNGAASWTRASALTAGRGSVSAIAVAPTNANYVLAGMSDGFILRTDIGLTSTSTTSWANVQPRAGYVSWVAFDPTNKDIAYATYSTFGGTHVWRSINGGASWTGIDGSGAGALPDIPVHCIVVDPLNTARLYIGTDLGVFVSTNGGASWAVENTGFANVIVESLNLNVVNGVTTLFAFTHGRGAWRVTVNQIGCLFALSPAGQSFTGAGGTGTINIAAAPSGCNWTATSTASWITINTGSSGSGNGSVGFTVAANTTVNSRVGTITAAGRTFTVTQQGCATIAPAFRFFDAAGGQGSVTVTSPAGCSWTTTNPDNWITINSGGSGAGNGTVNFTVAPNTSSVSRLSTLTVAGQTFTVLQAGMGGACASTPITIGQSLGGALATSDCPSLGRGGSNFADRYTFNGQAGQQIVIGMSAPRFDTYLYLLDAAGAIVTQADDGGGGASETDSRIPETGSFFMLPATGVYTIEATSFGANRTGSYTVSLSGGSPNCSYAIATTSQSFGINGGAGSVNVTAGAGCAWQAVSQVPWITINSGANASGNGTVNYTVAANSTVGPRTGTIIIAGQVFSVTQGGLPALYRGEWRGTTSDGLPVRFHVDANDMLIYLEVDVRVSFSVGTCTYTLVSTDVAPIESGQFAVPLTSTGFLLFSQTPFARGTLTSSTASGRTDNLQVFLAICANTLIFTSTTATGPTWNVQRQVACPTVTNITPTSGPVGTNVTITGTNFTDVTGVKFGGNVTAAYTVNSDTQITTTVPNGAITGPITISKSGCSDVQTAPFTVITCPTVSGVNPPSGLVGSAVTITGSNFSGVTAVRFANNVAAQFTINSATSITATVPAGAVTGPITISKTGCPDVQTASFTVCPAITLAPASLPAGITNTAYNQTVSASPSGNYTFSVTAGALPPGLSLNQTTGAITGTPTRAGTSNFTITALSPGPCSGSQAYSLTINNPEPAITSLSPPSATAGGAGFTLMVNGSNFISDSVVRWNGAARATTVLSNTQLTTSITAADIATAGAAVITVFNPTPGGGISNPRSFTINPPGYEADVAPRPNGSNNGMVTVSDWTQVGRFVAGLDTANQGNEFQRADCAPLSTFGDGRLTPQDWVQAGLYAVGQDPVAPAGGPLTPAPLSTTTASLFAQHTLKSDEPRLLRIITTDGSPGTARTVMVELNAQGDESALGFSLHFNPSEWRFASAEPGRDTQQAVIHVNANEAARGRIGLLLALPDRGRFSAGARHIVSLKFASLSESWTRPMATGLADEPVAREIVSSEAVVLPARYEIESDIGALSNVSAASLMPGELARGQIVAAFGENLATTVQGANALPLPSELSGVRVLITDSKGVERPAALFFVSPAQINYLLPEEMAEGVATVKITNAEGAASIGIIQVAASAPSLFTANADGEGVAAAIALRIGSDGTRSYEPVAQFDSFKNRFAPAPIDLGADSGDSGDQVYLILFGTGVRNRRAHSAVICKIGGVDAPVSLAGAQGEFAGLDQINIGPLPRSLAGRGEVDVVLTVDGKTANTVSVNIK
jgi:uncharacterized protein (TIGR03437 family)